MKKLTRTLFAAAFVAAATWALTASVTAQNGKIRIGSTPPAKASYLPAFFGFIHVHTSYSVDYKGDGGETPADAFAFARDVAGLDWMATSDHAESFVGPSAMAHWNDTLDAANAATQDGVFVALRAFEYSNSIQGHVCVLNTDYWTNWEKDNLMASFYSWLSYRPDAIVTFNHPGSYDIFNNEFYHFDYRPDVAPMFFGMEMLNGGSRFDSRDKGYDGEVSFLDEALLKGWWLAPISGEDSHRPNWGTTTDNRTGVLATELTKEGLFEAFRARRVYASEDKNAYLSFQLEGNEMGSRVLKQTTPTFDVYFSDPDAGEEWTKIQVFKNGVLYEETDFSLAGSGTAQFDGVAPGQSDYYYVRVHQLDGERVQSAPIWVSYSSTATVVAN